MIRYQYVSVPRRHNPIVVAFLASSNSDTEINISMGASFCCKRDKFDRRIGRNIASGRVNKKPLQFTVKMSGGDTFNTAVSRGINEFVSRYFTKINHFYTPAKTADSLIIPAKSEYAEVHYFGI
jgi:hypothetical protein